MAMKLIVAFLLLRGMSVFQLDGSKMCRKRKKKRSKEISDRFRAICQHSTGRPQEQQHRTTQSEEHMLIA